MYSGEMLLEEETYINLEDQDFDPPLFEEQGKCPLIHVGPITF